MKINRGNLRSLLIVTGLLLGRPTPALLALGCALIAAGGALHLWAKGCLRQNRALATGGPYRFVRNPFYLANLAIDLGLCVVIGRWWIAAVYLSLWLLVYGRTMRGEERRLHDLFGEPYTRYVARVPRLLPLRRPLPAAEAGPSFSWDNPNLASGREYARLARIAIAPFLLFVVDALWRHGTAPLTEIHSLAGSALVLIACLRCLQIALERRFKRDRTVVPRPVQKPAALALALLAFAAGLFFLNGHDLEDAGLLRASGLVLGALAFAGLAWAPLASLAAARAALAASCLVSGALVGLPSLGIVGATWFAMLAVDARVGAAERESRARAAAPGRRVAVAVGGVALFAVAGARLALAEGWL